MSEKALFFGALDSYKAIMNEPSPKICKLLGRQVKNFDSSVWNAVDITYDHFNLINDNACAVYVISVN